MEITLTVNKMDSKNNKLKVGDFIFAKLNDYIPWPARIIKFKKDMYKVIYFGSGEFANLQKKDIFPYLLNKDKFMTEQNLQYEGFRKAVDEIEAALHEKDSTTVSDDVPVSAAASDVILEGASCADNSNHDETNINIDESISEDHEERNLIALCEKVHNSLRIRLVYMDCALEALRQLKALKPSRLMLLRNPGCVLVIRLVRNYVGCLHNWNLNQQEEAAFKLTAAKIRTEAAIIFNNFRELFLVPPEQDFWKEFEKRVEQFRVENGITINEE